MIKCLLFDHSFAELPQPGDSETQECLKCGLAKRIFIINLK